MDHPTAQLALTQSGNERRRRAEADADAAAEEVRHAGLAVELAAAQAEISALRHAHDSGSGSEPQAEPESVTPALLGAVRSNGALLTLVCLADSATMQVPLSSAAAESSASAIATACRPGRGGGGRPPHVAPTTPAHPGRG